MIRNMLRADTLAKINKAVNNICKLLQVIELKPKCLVMTKVLAILGEQYINKPLFYEEVLIKIDFSLKRNQYELLIGE